MTSTREDRILSNMALVNLMVKDFTRKNPQFRHLSADLRSNAKIKLIETVDKFPDEGAHFRNYLRISIRTACWDAVRSENVIQSPRIHDGKRRPLFVDDKRPDMFRHRYLDEVGVPECPPVEILEEGEFHEFTSEETIERACEDDTDLWILRFAMAGRERKYIASELDLRPIDVKKRVIGILERFRELY